MQGNDDHLGQVLEQGLRMAKEKRFHLPLRVRVEDAFGQILEMVGDENETGGFRFEPVRMSTESPLVLPMTMTISEASGDREIRLEVTGPDQPRTQ